MENKFILSRIKELIFDVGLIATGITLLFTIYSYSFEIGFMQQLQIPYNYISIDSLHFIKVLSYIEFIIVAGFQAGIIIYLIINVLLKKFQLVKVYKLILLSTSVIIYFYSFSPKFLNIKDLKIDIFMIGSFLLLFLPDILYHLKKISIMPKLLGKLYTSSISKKFKLFTHIIFFYNFFLFTTFCQFRAGSIFAERLNSFDVIKSPTKYSNLVILGRYSNVYITTKIIHFDQENMRYFHNFFIITDDKLGFEHKITKQKLGNIRYMDDKTYHDLPDSLKNLL